MPDSIHSLESLCHLGGSLTILFVYRLPENLVTLFTTRYKVAMRIRAYVLNKAGYSNNAIKVLLKLHRLYYIYTREVLTIRFINVTVVCQSPEFVLKAKRKQK